MRDKRCKKSEAQIAEHLTGNRREDHLFNLKMAPLRLHQEVQDIIAAYDQQIMRLLVELQAPERARLELPPHPNPAKEKAIKRRGKQSLRTTLWRFSGVDLTRIVQLFPVAPKAKELSIRGEHLNSIIVSIGHKYLSRSRNI